MDVNDVDRFPTNLASVFRLPRIKQSILYSLKVAACSAGFSIFSSMPYALAAPAGGNIVGGAGSINSSGLTTNINQLTQSLAIDWQSFDVNSNEIVNFSQPGFSSIALNRILGSNASQIFGQINANGQVVLVNPNGIFFGAGASVNVGGLIASGLDISPADFLNGDYIFNEVIGTDGAVINSGLINASLGGNVALIGKQVENKGVISAQLGSVNMAAGKAAVLTFDQQGLLGVRVTEAVLQEELGVDPAVLNSGEINAEGGRVLLTASVSQDVFSQAVNAGGIEQATSVVVNDDGTFTLGGGADVGNSGVVNVSATSDNVNAGEVVMLGENIDHSGSILADTESGVAGHVELHASDKVELTSNGRISAQASHSGKGGLIKVLGDKVGLLDSAEINASGVNGGGEVLVGGDEQGLNSLIRNAEFLYLGQDSNIFADALGNGNGGKIITFANDTGRFYGGLFARGGLLGGDGGFIETSGKKGFELPVAPDVSASLGLGGLWLIDPYDLTIQNSGGDVFIPTGPNPTIYTSTASAATIDVGTIQTGLSNGSVEIRTVAGGGENGDITFAATLDYNGLGDFGGSGSNTLTLNAEGGIGFIASSSIGDTSDSGDSLHVNLFANDAITLSIGVIIDTQGGDFTVGGAGGNTPTSFDASTSSTIDTTGRENFNGGQINITTSGIINTGILTANGGVSNRGGGNSNGVVGRNGGAINLQAGGLVTINGAINSNGSTGDYNNSDSNVIFGEPGGNGGAITIQTTSGDIVVSTMTDTISSMGAIGSGDTQTGNGADPANGGHGGDVIISSNTGNAAIYAIATTGGIGVGAAPGGGAGGATAQSGNAGDITITGATGITLNADLDAVAGAGNGGGGAYVGTIGTGGAITLTGNVTLENK